MRRIVRTLAALVVVLAFIANAGFAHAVSQTLRFDRLTTEDGLSQSHVLCMIQDSKGFIWIGNYSGLNRYDGNEVVVFRNILDDPRSLSDNNIRALLEDSKGALWVGTKTGGLNRYDRKTGTFKAYKHDPTNPGSISGNSVRALYEDGKGTLWVGTFNGLNRFDPDTETFTSYRNDPGNPDSISNNEIRVIAEDLSGTLWVGTEHGLNRFDPGTGSFTRYMAGENGAKGLRHDLVLSLFAERPGELWVGTEEGGLHLMDIESGVFEPSLDPLEVDAIYKDSRNFFWVGTEDGLALRKPRKDGSGKWDFEFYRNNPFDDRSLSNNEVRVIFEDLSGVLWVGTYANGASRLSPKVQSFGLYRHEPWNVNSLAGPVAPFVWSEGDILWVGNLNNGLNRVDRSTGEITRFNEENGGLPSNKINYVFGDSRGMLWVGTQNSGLVAMDRATAKVVKVYRHDPEDDTSLSMDNVWYIYEDREGTLWVGTSKRGLNKFNPEAETFTRYLHHDDDPESLSHNRIRNIFEDSKGNFWIGTNAGLNLFDRATGKARHWEHDPSDPNSISNDRATPIVETPDGGIWVGTDKGLNRFDVAAGTFKRYTVKDGLRNDSIQGLVVDRRGTLWASTYKGIFKMNPATGEVLDFDVKDGLQGNEFWMNGYTRTEKGEVVFGGTQGVTVFDPEKIKLNTVPPPVVITGLKVMNKPAELAENITETKEITLSYKDRFFAFAFAALDYNNPSENRFQYMLEGFDKEWVDSGTVQTATYTNFDHGTYTFRVRASNSDGVWNEEGASVRVIITPPFWKTWWFRSLVILVFVVGIWLGIKLRLRATEAQKKTLGELVESRTEDLRLEVEEHKNTSEQLRVAKVAAEEANASKSVFLSTMSHEIRTPLNAIIGTADLLGETQITSQQMRYVELLQSSGETLLAIINDILDFSKIEAGQIELENIRFPLRDEVESAAATLASQAHAKGLELICRVAPGVSENVVGDPTRLRQILLNLLANAVKFTETGEVQLSVEPAPASMGVDTLLFSVRDTGVGIDAKKLEAVFDPFLQADSSTTRRYGGTGLGLAICRQLVKLMGGRIWVESEPGKGADFHFTAVMPKASDSKSQPAPELSGSRVLVVDDNNSSRNVLSECLAAWGAKADGARDGETALELLRQHGLDAYSLLFIDQLMAGMDGLSLAKRIRAEFEGMMTPIVMLTQGYVDCQDMFPQLGINSCCQKPLKRRELIRAVFEATGEGNITGAANAHHLEKLLPPLRILLAEDNPSNREIVRLYLMNSPVKLDMSEDGEQAVNLFRENEYDIVLMDMEMPVLDGYAATEAMRAMEKEVGRKHTPIIALTAHSFAEHRERCRRVGCDDYLVKPVKKMTLLDALAKHAGGDALTADARPQEKVNETFRELIGPFIEHTRDDCKDMEDALIQLDFPVVRRLGHKVGGAAYGFGLKGLGRLCKEIELLADAKDESSLRLCLADVYRYLDKVQVIYE